MSTTLISIILILLCAVVIVYLQQKYNDLLESIDNLPDAERDTLKLMQKHGEFMQEVNQEITNMYNGLCEDLVRITNINQIPGLIEHHNKLKDDLNKKINKFNNNE